MKRSSYLKGRSQKVSIESREGGFVATSRIARSVGLDAFEDNLLSDFPGIWLEVRSEPPIESSDFVMEAARFDVFVATSLGQPVGERLTTFQTKMVDYLARTADFLEFKLGHGSDEF